MMKKIILLLILILCICTGCSQTAQNTDALSVVSVSFPGYAFAKEIAGENAEITLLLPVGSEAHGYEPTPKDMIRIQNCDVFIYGGGESEHWVEEVLSSLDNEIRTISMLDCASLLTEEIPKGAEHGHDHESAEADEHVWTSPANAMAITKAISAAICEKDPEHAGVYKNNTALYLDALEALDKEFEETILNASRREIVVGDRFPFLYMAKAYGIDYYAAFPGCAGEAEPSAATIAGLIEKVKADNIPVVFYTEFSNQKVAKTICEATGAKPLMLHSCHNVSREDFEAGVSYTDLMRQNLLNLKEALN